MKLMKVPALPALCSDITDEMVESENAVICLPPALCSVLGFSVIQGYLYRILTSSLSYSYVFLSTTSTSQQLQRVNKIDETDGSARAARALL